MFREIKFVIYFFTVFFFIFFIIKFYLSENNINRNNIILKQFKNETDKSFTSLPIIKNDTDDIVEYTNEIEEFKKSKKRLFWKLFKTDEK